MKKSKQRKYSKIPDLILLIFYLGCVLYFIVEAIMGQLIPLKYILIVGIILIVIFIFFYLSYHFAKGGSWVRRIFTGILSILLIIGSMFQGDIRNAFNKINDGSESIEGISLVVLSESHYQTSEELRGAEIGFIALKDVELNQFAQQQLNGYEMTFHEVADAISLGNALLNKTYEAVLISNATLSVMKNNSEEFKNKLSVIEVYEKKATNSEVSSNKDITKEPFTVYISGLDSIGIPNYNGLSDVNMLLMVNPITHHIEMVSIPRDSYIPNLAVNSFPDKLTHTGNSGIDNTIQSMEKVFGFDIDFYAKVSFSSLIEIINTLGGIDVDVQIEFMEQDENRDFTNQIHLYPGLQRLNGREALAYARHRHSEGWGDIGRTTAQQQIIAAIINRMLSAEGISKVPAVLNVGAEFVSTNMPTSVIKNFVNKELANITPWSFSGTSLENGLNSQQLCATALEYGGLFVYFLNLNDLGQVYAKHQAMYQPINFKSFSFDLNDLSKSDLLPPDNPYLLTMYNYQERMAKYFSSMVYIPPVIPSTPEVPEEEPTPPVEEPSQQPEEPIDPSDQEEVPVAPDSDEEELPINPAE